MNSLTWEFDEYGFQNTNPIVINILNYFPYQKDSYFIISTHKKFPCRWSEKLIADLNTEDLRNQAISDIITYRLEFWGISSDIIDSWHENKIKQFIHEGDKHWDNHNFNIRSNFNIFE
jgi:hypothetical protein